MPQEIKGYINNCFNMFDNVGEMDKFPEKIDTKNMAIQGSRFSYSNGNTKKQLETD